MGVLIWKVQRLIVRKGTQNFLTWITSEGDELKAYDFQWLLNCINRKTKKARIWEIEGFLKSLKWRASQGPGTPFSIPEQHSLFYSIFSNLFSSRLYYDSFSHLQYQRKWAEIGFDYGKKRSRWWVTATGSSAARGKGPLRTIKWPCLHEEVPCCVWYVHIETEIDNKNQSQFHCASTFQQSKKQCSREDWIHHKQGESPCCWNFRGETMSGRGKDS